MKHLIQNKGDYLTQFGLSVKIPNGLEAVITNYQKKGKFDLKFGEIKTNPTYAPNSEYLVCNLYENSPLSIRIENKLGDSAIITGYGFDNNIESVLQDLININDLEVLEPSEEAIRLLANDLELKKHDSRLANMQNDKIRKDTFKYMISIERY